jgi:2-oxoglutarate ferredoxin oxidoreductase subunit gamma
MLKSHGTEQRGGYVRSQIVISNNEIDSPAVEEPDFFLAFSLAAYNAYCSLVREGIILYDPAYVTIDETLPIKQLAIPAKELAIGKLGKELFSNSIMLGAATRVTGFFDPKNMLQTLLDIIPKFKDKNREGFEIGLNLDCGR